ncbi:patatin-like phospholipase family protein [Thalassotalea euphylliae]|uniref:patatin-like phospholipase family protein n=1 Tax=Thalassotalea euphylliae TaxID=1655234 RepID=UPI0015F27E7A|nr:DUF6363 domain-containing protein [Thalassotalea euphylliae]
MSVCSAFTQPIDGLALVAEGGGQRGIFTAGVLDSWQVAKFNPFKVLIGTSAGAQNIASYLSGQHGYAYSLITDLTRKPDFFSPWRLFGKQHVMDLDWYFEQAAHHHYAFDAKAATQNAHDRVVRFSAAKPKSLSTKLLDPTQVGWLPSLKRSSAIPYLYKSANLVDGGVSAPLPVKEAFELGGNTIVTIRTTATPPTSLGDKISKLKPLLCRNNRCPLPIRILDKHESAYQQTQQFIEQPPADVKVLEVKPFTPLSSKVLGSSKAALVDDYRQGVAAGQQFIQTFTATKH